MHKISVTYLGAFIFVWLLTLTASPALAYYPPLQATATPSTYGVKYKVYNTKLQKDVEGGSYYWENSFVELKQHNGVIAWVLHHPLYGYYVFYCVYDPALEKFVETAEGPFAQVSQLTVQDGVLAYVADIPPSGSDPGHSEFRYATYDPALQAWQKHSEYLPGMQPQSVVTKDGVVLMQYIWGGTYWFVIEMYDPVLGGWWWGTGLENQAGFVYITINNASVSFSLVDHGVQISDTFGCTIGLGNGWHWGITTPPQAYFVAQPKLGSSPLWVWFTDMSIAGANWSYNFGDGSFLSMNRSPYYTFTSPGNFQVSQQINGPSTYTQTIIVGYPSTLKGNSLPAILHLLLLAD